MQLHLIAVSIFLERVWKIMKITLADWYTKEGFKMTVNHENLKFEEKSIDLFQNSFLIC